MSTPMDVFAGIYGQAAPQFNSDGITAMDNFIEATRSLLQGFRAGYITVGEPYGHTIQGLLQWIGDLGNVAIANGHLTSNDVKNTERLIEAGLDLAASFSGINWTTLESLD